MSFLLLLLISFVASFQSTHCFIVSHHHNDCRHLKNCVRRLDSRQISATLLKMMKRGISEVEDTNEATSLAKRAKADNKKDVFSEVKEVVFSLKRPLNQMADSVTGNVKKIVVRQQDDKGDVLRSVTGRPRRSSLEEEIKKFVDGEKGTLSFKNFRASCEVSRTGERKLTSVTIQGRPPTRRNNVQGEHITAASLFERAISNGLIGTLTFRTQSDSNVNIGNSKKEELVPKLKTILQFDGSNNSSKNSRARGNDGKKLTRAKVDKRLEILSRFTELESKLLKDDVNSFRKDTRKILTVRTQAISRSIEDIYRLWNKRANAVYYLDRVQPKKKESKDEKKKANIRQREDVKKFQNLFKAAKVGTVEGLKEKEALLALDKINKNGSGTKTETVHFHLRRLIDLKQINEEDLGEINKQFYNILDGEDVNASRGGKTLEEEEGEIKGKIYKTALISYESMKKSAIKEAIRLAKIAYPKLKFKEKDLTKAFETYPNGNEDLEEKKK